MTELDWLEVANELTPYLRQGDLPHCIERVTGILKALPPSPYHAVLELEFTNDPASVAASFDHFVAVTAKDHKLAALYTETNGFFINPEGWYFNIFGYTQHGGHDDYNWLADWRAVPCSEPITLMGMESLQQVYRHHRDTDYYGVLSNGGDPEVEQMEIANQFCDLLVVLRFQALIRRSVGLMKQVNIPILATSHEYDVIDEVHP